MKDHDYERKPTSRAGLCKQCGKGMEADAHMDVVLSKPIESMMIKGPDGVIVWVSSVLNSTQVNVYESVEHGPTVSYSSAEHVRRERYIRTLGDRIREGPKTSGIDID